MGTHLFDMFISYPFIGTQLHSERNRIVERHVAHLRLHSITAILNTVVVIEGIHATFQWSKWTPYQSL